MYYYYNPEVAMRGDENHFYHYIWSLSDQAFIRYTGCKYDLYDYNFTFGKLVVSQPQERVPITKLLSAPMVFRSPITSCEWVMSVANNIPATYRGQPILTGGYESHRQPNGLIIDVSDRTFSWSSHEAPSFKLDEDGVILRVLDSNGELIYPPSIFEPGEKELIANSPQQALMVIKHILALQL